MFYPTRQAPPKAQNKFMFSFICLLSSAAILFFILRYRVHIHISAEPATARTYRRTRRRNPRPTHERPSSETITLLTDTLIGLGASRTAARKSAIETVEDQPEGASIEQLLKYALKNCTTSSLKPS
jgi:hypothetical protein